MAKDKKLWIDMCAGSELKDTQGETLSVEGADISDLENGNGRLNDNHGKGFFNSLGRVTEAKKIFKSEDCDNDRHKYFWEKIKAPFIYAKGYLYSDEDHPNAKAAAAILRNIHREDAPLAMKASVEGGVLARGISDSSKLARTKIHSVALTFTPANNATLVEPLNIDKTAHDWDTDMQLIKSVMHLAETNVPSFRHIQRHASANAIYENIKKIQELAKSLGIDIEVKAPSPETIIENAVFSKVQSNIFKINELVKQIKVNQLGMISAPSKLNQSPNVADSFLHPELVTRWQGKGAIPEGHVDRQPMVDYINNLKNTPHPQGLNTNVSEAKRLYDTHIADFSKGEGARAAKGVALAIGLAHGAHYINQPPTEIKEHARAVHKELESQKQKTTKEHNSRISSDDMKLSPKEYGFDEKKPAISSIDIKNKLKKAFEKELDKALTAGYGGGMPTDMVGGGVIQSQSLEPKRKKKVKKNSLDFVKSLQYITCDNCGHEQVHMPHQVKCRECKHNFSLYRLNNLK